MAWRGRASAPRTVRVDAGAATAAAANKASPADIIIQIDIVRDPEQLRHLDPVILGR
jgi:hypothetical protein